MFEDILFDNQSWHLYWNTHDPNKLWDIINNMLSHSVDVLCPRRKVTIREDQYLWVDKKLRLELQNKNRQFRKAQQNTLMVQLIN